MRIVYARSVALRAGLRRKEEASLRVLRPDFAALALLISCKAVKSGPDTCLLGRNRERDTVSNPPFPQKARAPGKSLLLLSDEVFDGYRFRRIEVYTLLRVLFILSDDAVVRMREML